MVKPPATSGFLSDRVALTPSPFEVVFAFFVGEGVGDEVEWAEVRGEERRGLESGDESPGEADRGCLTCMWVREWVSGRRWTYHSRFEVCNRSRVEGR